jgi:hypothetical protein
VNDGAGKDRGSERKIEQWRDIGSERMKEQGEIEGRGNDEAGEDRGSEGFIEEGKIEGKWE